MSSLPSVSSAVVRTAPQSGSHQAAFDRLPPELLVDIVGRLDATEDVSAVTRLSKRCRSLFLDDLMARQIRQRRLTPGVHPDVPLVELFLHSVKHDTVFIVEGLHQDRDIRGVIPFLVAGRGITFLAFALLADAPRIAAYLLRTGSDLDLDNLGHLRHSIPFPDLIALLLAIAGAWGRSQRKLDWALRIACRYAMPRTVRLLLTFGADPNVTAIGGAPIHVAVGRRKKPALLEQLRPYTSGRTKFRNGRFELDPDHGVVLEDHAQWLEEMEWQSRIFVEDELSETGWRYATPSPGVPSWVCLALGGSSTSSLPKTPKYAPFTSEEWDERILNTVTALLEFRADPLALKPSLRSHSCTRTCWRSLDCDQQTAMHFAAATNFPAVISLLVSRGVDPLTPNQEGYTPLYAAIANSQPEAALLLLLDHHSDANPIVGNGLTALRAAARFAFPKLISTLLARGADPNELDARGWSPLHELLANTDTKREDDVVESLDVFWKGPTKVNLHICPDNQQENAVRRRNGGKKTSVAGAEKTIDTPWEMGRKHPLTRVRDLFFVDYHGNKWKRYNLVDAPIQTAEEMRHERLVREGKVTEHGWGSEYNANMRKDGKGEVRKDFPALGGTKDDELHGEAENGGPNGLPKTQVQGSWERPLAVSNENSTNGSPSLGGAPVGRNTWAFSSGRQPNNGHQGGRSSNKPLKGPKNNGNRNEASPPATSSGIPSSGPKEQKGVWTAGILASAGNSTGARGGSIPANRGASGGLINSNRIENKPPSGQRKAGNQTEAFPSLAPRATYGTNGSLASNTVQVGNSSWTSVVTGSSSLETEVMVAVVEKVDREMSGKQKKGRKQFKPFQW